MVGCGVAERVDVGGVGSVRKQQIDQRLVAGGGGDHEWCGTVEPAGSGCAGASVHGGRIGGEQTDDSGHVLPPNSAVQRGHEQIAAPGHGDKQASDQDGGDAEDCQNEQNRDGAAAAVHGRGVAGRPVAGGLPGGTRLFRRPGWGCSEVWW